jgi:hypothetical protein
MVNRSEIYSQFSLENKTYKVLSQERKSSMKTIQKLVDSSCPSDTETDAPKEVILLMDVVNVADRVKAMVIEDYLKKKVISVKEVDTEKVQIYRNSIEKLIKADTQVKGIVVDGRSGVIPALEEYAPVQMCHFHFVSIVTRYLGKKRSKTFQSLVLKHVSRTALRMGQDSFVEFISLYEDMYADYMNEKKINPETGRPIYAHKRIRQAFKTLNRFKDNLFTFECVEYMPNTTNALDGKISATKAKMNIHRGLKTDRKVRLFKYLIKR